MCIIIRQTRICYGETLFQQFVRNRNKCQLLSPVFLSLVPHSSETSVYNPFIELPAGLVVLTGIESAKKKQVAEFLIANLTNPASTTYTASGLPNRMCNANITAELRSSLKLGKTIGYYN